VGVDPQSRNAIFDTLAVLKAQGRALVYTSHYMEEVERLADHIVIIDHGKVLADATPAELYRRLPAQAALRIELAAPPTGELVSNLKSQPGVTGVEGAGEHLDIQLAQESDALPLMRWLADAGCQARHFATARTSLEDIFLNLTGRSLRD
jgi:ABC-2 type transport system ATP-binding protein